MQAIYEPFTDDEISAKISELLTPDDLDWKGEIRILFLGVKEMHQALPDNGGDWYFTGDYPTPGGYRVVNDAYLKWRSGDSGRAY